MPLSWTSVSGAASYDIWDTTGSTRVFVATTTSTSYTVTGLNSLTSYTFEVFAKNASGDIMTTTLTATYPSFMSLGEGMSGMNETNDWTAWGSYTAIPSSGRTVAMQVPNWFANYQTSVNGLSVMIGNLSSVAISGMRIAYHIMQQDYYLDWSAKADPEHESWGPNSIGSDPTTSFVLLGSSACNIPAGISASEHDATGTPITSYESYTWVDMPFGSYKTVFGVSLRILIPQYVSGQEYAAMWKGGNGFEVGIIYQLWLKTCEALGITTATNSPFMARWIDGDKVTSITTNSQATGWDYIPDGGGGALYDYPHVPTIPILGIRWWT